jgi:hypothetical protein
MKINSITGIGKEIVKSTFERTEIRVIIENTGRESAYIKKAFTTGIYSKEIVFLKCKKLITTLDNLTNLVSKYAELFDKDFYELKGNIEKYATHENLDRIIELNKNLYKQF